MSDETTVEKPVCELIGTDGNVFALMGKVSQALKRAGQADKAQEMLDRVMSCDSYDAALGIFGEYVEIV